MKTETRKLSDVCNSECKSVDGGFVLTLTGQSSKGRRVKFKIQLGWWIWPYIIREITKAWLPVRMSKLSEIASLDRTLKEGD